MSVLLLVLHSHKITRQNFTIPALLQLCRLKKFEWKERKKKGNFTSSTLFWGLLTKKRRAEFYSFCYYFKSWKKKKNCKGRRKKKRKLKISVQFFYRQLFYNRLKWLDWNESRYKMYNCEKKNEKKERNAYIFEWKNFLRLVDIPTFHILLSFQRSLFMRTFISVSISGRGGSLSSPGTSLYSFRYFFTFFFSLTSTNKHQLYKWNTYSSWSFERKWK